MKIHTIVILVGCCVLALGCKEPSKGTANKTKQGTSGANLDNSSSPTADTDANREEEKLLSIQRFIAKQEKDKAMLVYPGSAYKDLQVTHDPNQDSVTMTFHLADDSKFTLSNAMEAKDQLLPTYQKDRAYMNVIRNDTTIVNRVLKSDGSELLKFDFKTSDFPNYQF